MIWRATGGAMMWGAPGGLKRRGWPGAPCANSAGPVGSGGPGDLSQPGPRFPVSTKRGGVRAIMGLYAALESHSVGVGGTGYPEHTEIDPGAS